jgi:hypothetical protein
MSDIEKIKELESKIALYECPGGAALFYALNRKMNEIASLLNGVSLKNIDIASKSDASFDRVFKLLEKSEGISSAAKALGEFAGITNDEGKDTQTPKYRIVATPESMADSVGELAGKRN